MEGLYPGAEYLFFFIEFFSVQPSVCLFYRVELLTQPPLVLDYVLQYNKTNTVKQVINRLIFHKEDTTTPIYPTIEKYMKNLLVSIYNTNRGYGATMMI